MSPPTDGYQRNLWRRASDRFFPISLQSCLFNFVVCHVLFRRCLPPFCWTNSHVARQEFSLVLPTIFCFCLIVLQGLRMFSVWMPTGSQARMAQDCEGLSARRRMIPSRSPSTTSSLSSLPRGMLGMWVSIWGCHTRRTSTWGGADGGGQPLPGAITDEATDTLSLTLFDDGSQALGLYVLGRLPPAMGSPGTFLNCSFFGMVR